MRFIQTNDPGEDTFAKQLEGFVLKARKNERFKREYLAMNLHDRDMIKKGAQEKAMENALVAIKEFGISPQVAAEKMGAPLDKVLEALKDVAVTA